MEVAGGFLPVIRTIKSAASQLWAGRIALFWLLVLVGLANGVLDWTSSAASENDTSRKLLAVALSVLVYTVLAVRVHRLVLGADSSVRLSVRWSGRETRFLGWLVVVCCYLIVVFVALALLADTVSAMALVPQGEWWVLIIMFFGSLPTAYLFVRLSVLLPATAIDQRRTFAWAWTLTKGNGWRLVVLLWFIPMLLSILLPAFVLMPVFRVSSMLGWMALDLFLAVVTAYQIAVLSVAFQTLGGHCEAREALVAA